MNPSVLEPIDDSPTPAESSRANGNRVVLAADGFSADAYADRLMDDLFEEVERSLNTGTPLNFESPTPPPQPALGLVNQADNVLPFEPPAQWQAVPPAPVAPTLSQSELDLAVSAATVDDLASSGESALTQPAATGKSFDAWVMVLIFGSLATAAAVWYGLQLYWQRMATPQVAVSTETTAQANPADQDFLEYVQRSLGVIDRRTEISRQSEAIASNANNLPSVAVAGNPSASPTALERVYVPVYQPPLGMNLPGGSSASGAIAARPAPPSLSLPTLPLPTLPAAPSTGADPAARIPNIATTSTYSLVGTLELGDPSRSAALFVINGTTQRVQVGEAIGSSGWALVSVRGDEAIVRRNGEVRSITTGQRF